MINHVHPIRFVHSDKQVLLSLVALHTGQMIDVIEVINVHSNVPEPNPNGRVME